MMRRVLALVGVGVMACAMRGADRAGEMPYPTPDSLRARPIPVLSKHQVDKGGAGDPVAEASRALVGEQGVDVQPLPAPYQKAIMPDPFEYRNLVRPQPPLPEEPAPPLILPKK